MRTVFNMRCGLCGLLLLGMAGCASPRVKPVDDELARQTSLAWRAFAQGRMDAAATLYGQSLERAWAIYDQAAIADNAYNLAACLLEQERCAEALGYLAQSARMYEQMRQPVPAANRLLEARAAYACGDMARADRDVSEALTLAQAQDAPSIQAQALLLRAQWACRAEDTVAARTAWQQAMDVRLRGHYPVIDAMKADVKGQIELSAGNAAGALPFFDEAIALYKENAQYISMVVCMERAADACLQTGETRLAVARYLDVARCFYGQADYPSALRAVDVAMQEAASMKDDAWMGQATELFEKIRKKVEEINDGERLTLQQ
ncbi:MAG: tetratricopeptide repeat protein [Spartobacteria bacterium]|nr:tetratricopeptide repeat protein [Spartobacteria bacterium]